MCRILKTIKSGTRASSSDQSRRELASASRARMTRSLPAMMAAPPSRGLGVGTEDKFVGEAAFTSR